MRNKKYRSLFLPIFLVACSILGVVCGVFIVDTTEEKIFAGVCCVFFLAVAIFLWLFYVEITEDSIVEGIGGRTTKKILIADIKRISMSEGNKVILVYLKNTSEAASKPQNEWAFSEAINLGGIGKRGREAIAAIVGEIAKQINDDKQQ